MLLAVCYGQETTQQVEAPRVMSAIAVFQPILDSPSNVTGIVRFEEMVRCSWEFLLMTSKQEDGRVRVIGAVKNLPGQEHGWHVHMWGGDWHSIYCFELTVIGRYVRPHWCEQWRTFQSYQYVSRLPSQHAKALG